MKNLVSLFFLLVTMQVWACHNSQLQILSYTNLGDGTIKYQMYVDIDNGTLDGGAKGFSIMLHSENYEVTVDAYAPAFLERNGDSLIAYIGSEVGSSTISDFENLTNKSAIISYESNDNGIFNDYYGLDPYSDTIEIIINGCVDSFELIIHSNNSCSYVLDDVSCPLSNESPCP